MPVVPELRARRQCAACPWKKSTVPDRDIPGGYREDLHRRLADTIAEPGALKLCGPLRVMACHESRPGNEVECVGWLANQLGPGNNIRLRLKAMDGRYDGLRTVGPQHATLEETLPRRRARRRGARP